MKKKAKSKREEVDYQIITYTHPRAVFIIVSYIKKILRFVTERGRGPRYQETDDESFF